jgi:hypothetical protein
VEREPSPHPTWTDDGEAAAIGKVTPPVCG